MGTNRIAAGRLPVLARALEVEVGYFFEGLGGDGPSPEPVESQRLQLALGRDFLALPRAQQEAICEMVRALAAAPRPMDAAA